MKPRILFVHSVCPSQFSDLCEYLNEADLAQAYYMTTPGDLEHNQQRYRNLLPLQPDGDIMAPYAYYYSGKIERAGRIGLGLYRELKELLQKKPFDLIVAHGSLGSPHFIFDEFDVPVITYIEFPSYADHGWDPKYPPTDAQRLIDKNMQMLSYYEAIKSARTLVPTEYARGMFPKYLQPNIVAQFEGINTHKIAQREPCGIDLPAGKKLLGFAARDLSSAKGLESFITAAKQLLQQRQDVHFVIIGDPASTSYGYEQIFLNRKYGKDSGVHFIDHLMRQYQVDAKYFTRTGKLPYNRFSDLLHKIDAFMYPVQFGSGNWGLLELLVRGRPVVAAKRCYVPEIIEDGVNGLLVEQDNPDAWAQSVGRLLDDSALRQQLGENAITAAQRYHLPRAAQNYMALFTEVIYEHKAR